MILFLLAYLGGALTIVSPCILPVLPSCSPGRTGPSPAAGCRCWSAWLRHLPWWRPGRHRRRMGCRGQSVWPHCSFRSFGPFRRYAAVPRAVRPDDAARRRAGRALVTVCGAGRHGRRIFDPALAPAWGRDGPALAPCAGPLLGLILTGAALREQACKPRCCSPPMQPARPLRLRSLSLRRADLRRDEAFARDRRMDTAGLGAAISHCSRRDRNGSRHRLSHPRVPRKHGFARTRLARQIPFRGGHPTTAVRDHVGGPAMMTPNPALMMRAKPTAQAKNSPSRASCLRCLAQLHG